MQICDIYQLIFVLHHDVLLCLYFLGYHCSHVLDIVATFWSLSH